MSSEVRVGNVRTLCFCLCHGGEETYLTSPATPAELGKVLKDCPPYPIATSQLGLRRVRVAQTDDEEVCKGLKNGVEACKMCCLAIFGSADVAADRNERFLAAQNRSGIILGEEKDRLKLAEQKTLLRQVEYVNKYGSEAAFLWNSLKAKDGLDNLAALRPLLNKGQYNIVDKEFRKMQTLEEGLEEKEFLSRMFRADNFADMAFDFKDLFLNMAKKSSHLVEGRVNWNELLEKPVVEDGNERSVDAVVEDVHLEEKGSEQYGETAVVLKEKEPAIPQLSDSLSNFVMKVLAPEVKDEESKHKLVYAKTQIACRLGGLNFSELNHKDSITSDDASKLREAFDQLSRIDSSVCSLFCDAVMQRTTVDEKGEAKSLLRTFQVRVNRQSRFVDLPGEIMWKFVEEAQTKPVPSMGGAPSLDWTTSAEDLLKRGEPRVEEVKEPVQMVHVEKKVVDGGAGRASGTTLVAPIVRRSGEKFFHKKDR
jgi:hypothetical protein